MKGFLTYRVAGFEPAVLLPVISKYPVGYVLTWRHSFRPRFTMPGGTNQPFPENFRIFYNSSRTLFLKEVQDANVYKRK